MHAESAEATRGTPLGCPQDPTSLAEAVADVAMGALVSAMTWPLLLGKVREDSRAVRLWADMLLEVHCSWHAVRALELVNAPAASRPAYVMVVAP